MSPIDDPVFNNATEGSPGSPPDPNIRETIRRLLESQLFCVLCTQGDSQPYASLIAFAFTPDLKKIYFSTPTATRKYRLLEACDRIALLIDSRCSHTGDFSRVEAVTVTGLARQIQETGEAETGIRLLIKRHPYMEKFIRSESAGLFRIDAERYFHVTRFQEVSPWTP